MADNAPNIAFRMSLMHALDPTGGSGVATRSVDPFTLALASQMGGSQMNDSGINAGPLAPVAALGAQIHNYFANQQASSAMSQATQTVMGTVQKYMAQGLTPQAAMLKGFQEHLNILGMIPPQQFANMRNMLSMSQDKNVLARPGEAIADMTTGKMGAANPGAPITQSFFQGPKGTPGGMVVSGPKGQLNVQQFKPDTALVKNGNYAYTVNKLTGETLGKPIYMPPNSPLQNMYQLYRNAVANNDAEGTKIYGAAINAHVGGALPGLPGYKDPAVAAAGKGAAKSYTKAEEDQINALSQQGPLLARLTGSLGATGTVLGGVKYAAGKFLGENPQAEKFAATLNQQIAAMMTGAQGTRIKAALEALKETTPGIGTESQSIIKQQILPLMHMSFRTSLSDLISDLQANGRTIPPQIQSIAEASHSTPQEMAELNAARYTLNSNPGKLSAKDLLSLQNVGGEDLPMDERGQTTQELFKRGLLSADPVVNAQKFLAQVNGPAKNDFDFDPALVNQAKMAIANAAGNQNAPAPPIK